MYILSAVRTPFGTFGGSLKDLSATDLGVVAARAAIERSGVAASDVDTAVFGNVLQTSGDACYYARHVALRAGCRIEVPALTVNRLCGSGFEAVVQGATAIRSGEADICLVGGGESMSQAPFVARGVRWGIALGANPPLGDSLTEALRDAYAGCAMAETAENLAERFGLTRSDVDAYALRSQELARDAWGAAVTTRKLTPLARVCSWGVVGVEPREMGIGPVPASRLALARAGLTLDHMDLIEINEAFASQTIAVERDLRIPREKLNVHGGAIALTHPLAASGARITAHLVHALGAAGRRYGLGAACIGGGQGIAVIVERLG